MVKIKQQLVSFTNYKNGLNNPKKFITIHQTGNTSKGANAQAHANLQSGPNPRAASWHWQVDDKEAIQSFAHKFQLWHASDGLGSGNNESIGIEMCINSDGDYNKAINNLIDLIIYIMKKEGIKSTNSVVTHKWWAFDNKPCPQYIFEGKNGWTYEAIIKEINKRLGNTDVAPSAPKKVKPFESAIDYLTKKHGWKVSSDPTTYSNYPNDYGLRNYTVDGFNFDADCDGFHRAYDLYNNETNDVPAVTHGTVLRATDKGSFGTEVLVVDYNGYIWVYGHLEKGSAKFKQGDKIRQGQIIGLQGNTNFYNKPMSMHLHLQLLAPKSNVTKDKWYCPGLQIDRYNINNGDYNPVKPIAKVAKKQTVKKATTNNDTWKKNKHGTWWKEEVGTFYNGNQPIEARKEAPSTFFPSAGYVAAGAPGIKYREVMLEDGHVWIGYILNDGTWEYLPIRTWNGVAPGQKGYSVGPLWGTIK